MLETIVHTATKRNNRLTRVLFMATQTSKKRLRNPATPPQFLLVSGFYS